MGSHRPHLASERGDTLMSAFFRGRAPRDSRPKSLDIILHTVCVHEHVAQNPLARSRNQLTSVFAALSDMPREREPSFSGTVTTLTSMSDDGVSMRQDRTSPMTKTLADSFHTTAFRFFCELPAPLTELWSPSGSLLIDTDRDLTWAPLFSTSYKASFTFRTCGLQKPPLCVQRHQQCPKHSALPLPPSFFPP